MRLYKPKYRGRDGQKHKSQKWYLDFTDHQQVRRRIPAFTDRRQSEALGKKVEKLVICTSNTEPPDRDLSAWLEQLPQRLRTKLAEFGLLSKRRAAAGQTLADHLGDFRQLLTAGNTDTYVGTTCSRIWRVFNDCGFVYWPTYPQAGSRLWFRVFERRSRPVPRKRTWAIYLPRARTTTFRPSGNFVAG